MKRSIFHTMSDMFDTRIGSFLFYTISGNTLCALQTLKSVFNGLPKRLIKQSLSKQAKTLRLPRLLIFYSTFYIEHTLYDNVAVILQIITDSHKKSSVRR